MLVPPSNPGVTVTSVGQPALLEWDPDDPATEVEAQTWDPALEAWVPRVAALVFEESYSDIGVDPRQRNRYRVRARTGIPWEIMPAWASMAKWEVLEGA